MLNTSRPAILKYCRAHQPGCRPARMTDATVPAAISRIASMLAGLEYQTRGAVQKFEAVVACAVDIQRNG